MYAVVEETPRHGRGTYTAISAEIGGTNDEGIHEGNGNANRSASRTAALSRSPSP
ncbi:MAG: hypothetical protein PPHEINF_0379 [uncultured Paraburkholderia sp.]|nr:MAG: hypothetical protein PPHEINF_0379 [uncultured Paraburkholderia sp.]CAH2775624.1 MAG: hypothetical protein PPHEESC_0376 [uncultured Paraburkholderia sp.]CAH2909873.1 MAG: hypothetical protein PPHEMADMSA_0409 [uncultured Paraburkholderia sp.]